MSVIKQNILSKTCKKNITYLRIDYFSNAPYYCDGCDVAYKPHIPEKRKIDINKYWQGISVKKYKNKIIEKEMTDEECYNKFIKNTKLKPKTTKHKTIPKWMCPVCLKNKVQSKHHIIPRKYIVNNDKINLIWLCNSCHDEIETKTEEWIESGKIYSSGILRSMILNGGL